MEKRLNVIASPDMLHLLKIAVAIEGETVSEWVRTILEREARKTIKRVDLVPYNLLNTTKEPKEMLLEALKGDSATADSFLALMNVWRALAWVSLGVGYEEAIQQEQKGLSPKQYSILKTKGE